MPVPVLLVFGCAGAKGPAVKVDYLPGYVECGQTGIYNPTSREFDDIADCMRQAPEVEKTYDPLVGYYIFEGEGEEKMQECLINRHGWKKIDPSKCLEGTMAGPYPLQPYQSE